PTDETLVGRRAVLRAERSADIGCDDAHLRDVEPIEASDAPLRAEHALTRGPLREARAVPHGGRDARLHGRRSETVVDEAGFDHHLAAGEDVVVTHRRDLTHHVGADLWEQ